MVLCELKRYEALGHSADAARAEQQLLGYADMAIFDLFEIRGAREPVPRFYETVGRVEAPADQVADAGA